MDSSTLNTPPLQSSNRWSPQGWARFLPAALGLLTPAAAVAGLGSEVLEREPFPYETASMLWLHAHTGPGLQAFSDFMNVLGGPHVTFPVMMLLPVALWLANRRPAAVFTLTAFWAAMALQWALKIAFGRPRPDLWAAGVHVSGLSFPSGHATAAAAIALIGTLLVWRTKWHWMALMLGGMYAAAMGLSRVVLGVHYPTDVLAGFCTALFSVTGTYLLLRPGRGGK